MGEARKASRLETTMKGTMYSENSRARAATSGPTVLCTKGGFTMVVEAERGTGGLRHQFPATRTMESIKMIKSAGEEFTHGRTVSAMTDSL